MLLSSFFPDSVRSRQSNAEVLRWQARFRVAFGLLVGVAGGALRWARVLAPSPVARRALGGGDARPLAALALLVAAYLVVVLVVDWRVRGRAARRPAHGAPEPAREPAREAALDPASRPPVTTPTAELSPPVARPLVAGRGLVLAVTAADLALVFGATFLLTPPGDYERALLLSFFGLQITQIYFGRVAATLWAVATELAYVLLLDTAEKFGATVRWPDEIWTLALFAFGVTLFILLLGNQAARLGRLVQMFERAEEGDFSMTYDVRADTRPDNVTLVGRAYNRMRAQLATIVLTDPLSECLNRRGFEQQLQRDVRRAARSNGEVALIAVDLDHFKEVNDRFGHLAGDAVIREAGQLLRETARGGDVVARVGGEEFVILAPDTSVEGALHLGSRVAEAFRARRFAGVDGRMAVTASVGVVSDRVRDEHAGGDLRARADEALYAAKRGGRDRVVLWESGERLGTTGEMKVPGPR